MIDLHLFALNCNESFRIVVDEKEKRGQRIFLVGKLSFKRIA